MLVTIGNKQYLIEGMLLGGQLPAWMLIKYEGKQMTANQFNKLPDADKLELTRHVQQHIKNMERR